MIFKQEEIQVSSIDEVRAWIFDKLLLVMLVLGVPALVSVLIPRLENKQWGLAAIYSLFYVVALCIHILRKRYAYRLRAILAIILLFILGAFALSKTGLYGSGAYILLTGTVLSSLLLGMRAGIIHLIASLMVILAIGIGIQIGLISKFISPLLDPQNEFYWIQTFIFYLLIAGILATASGFLTATIGKLLSHVEAQTIELGKDKNELARKLDELRQTQSALLRERTTLEAILEHNPYSMVMYDSEGHYIRSNPAFLDLFQAPPPPPEYTFFDDPNLAEAFQDRFDRLKKGELVWFPEIEYNIKLVNPNVDVGNLWVKTVAFSLKDEQGKINNYIVMHKDVTERKEAVRKLTESEARYRLLAENASDVLWTMNPQMEFTYVSPSVKKMFGYTQEEALANPMHKIMPPESVMKIMTRFSNLLTQPVGREPIILEVEQYRADGSKFWTEVNIVTVLEEGSEVLHVQGLTRDISERKKMETELIEKENAMRALLDASQDFAILTDFEGNILTANKKITDFMNITREKILEKRGRDYLSEEVVAKLDAIKQKLKEKKKPIFFTDRYMQRDLQHVFNPVFDGKGEVIQIAAFSRDITEQKKNEQRIKQYQEELRALATQLTLVEENERRKVASALHDGLGQSLAFANIQLKMLTEEMEDASAKERLMDICVLIDRLIEQARSLTFELSPPAFYEMQFEDALEWLFDSYRKRFNIPGEFKILARDYELSMEVRLLLFHAYRELLINTFKHSNAERIDGSLRKRIDGMIELTLRDNGKGFAFDELNNKENGSLGFGLFSIRERLRRFHGSMDIKSIQGKGSIITIYLPPSVSANLGE